MSRTRPYCVTLTKSGRRVSVHHGVFLCAKHAERARRGTACFNGAEQLGTVTAIEAQGPAGPSICEACDGGWRFELPAPAERPA